MKFNDKELEAIKIVLTDHLDSYADPSLHSVLAKDIAYLSPKHFDGVEPEDIYPFQTALRKVIEEIIMRQVNGSGKEA